MAYSYRGQGRSRFSPRPSFNANRAPKRGKIDRARYVNTSVQPVEPEAVYEITHAFADFGLDERLFKNVEQHGYTTPTPIQDQAIPALMQGKDVVGIANTGTGKTAAFLLPLINKVLADKNQGVLIVAPTRELALQIQEELVAFTRNLPVSQSLCIGGANIGPQISRLRNNPHFVIGTPGRLKDLLNRGVLHMEMFTNIVLDEVDRMLDIGFRQDIKFLISYLPTPRQAAFFSATMDRDTEEIMRDFLVDPVKIRVSTRQTSHHIEQDVVRIKPGENKVDILHRLLQQDEFEKVIVFGRTKHGINKLEQQLYDRGIRVSAIHGNKTQSARQRSLQEFKRGQVQALLATDIAARGIDIEGVTHVINYDEPQTYEDYIHRIGRTGRAGKTGKALTFLM